MEILFQITMQSPHDLRTATLVFLICMTQNVHAKRTMGSCQSCITTSPSASNTSAFPAASSVTPTAAADEFFNSTWVAPVTYLLAFYDIVSVLLLIQRFFINHVSCLTILLRGLGDERTSDNAKYSSHPSIGNQHDGILIGIPTANWKGEQSSEIYHLDVTCYRSSNFGY